MSDIMVPLEQLREEQRMVAALKVETIRLRQKNKELNRRAQLAESAARQNIEACKKQGISMGRALANYAFKDLQRRMREVIEGAISPPAAD